MGNKPGSESQRLQAFPHMCKIDPQDMYTHKTKYNHIHIYIYNVSFYIMKYVGGRNEKE
jgi:hypothetical protein